MSDTHITRTKGGLDIGTAADLADLFYKLSHDKKTRKAIAKAVKDLAPESPHAAAFSDVEIEDKFEKFKEEQSERQIKDQQEALLARMNMQRNKLLTGDEEGGRKYSEDDVKKIEALMQKKGISDYDDGAVLYASTLPPDNPRPGDKDIPSAHGATWEFPEWAKFGKDPVGASRDTAHTVISEFMRAKR
jgi:hypothetical protein